MVPAAILRSRCAALLCLLADPASRSGAFGAAAVHGAYPRLSTLWPLPRHNCIFISTQSSTVLCFYGNCILAPTLKILTVPTASCPPSLYTEFCCASHSLPRTPTNPPPPPPSTIIAQFQNNHWSNFCMNLAHQCRFALTRFNPS